MLRQTAYYCGLVDCLNVFEWENLNHRSVNDEGTNLHHAIIPTGIYPCYLPKETKIIYEMITARTLEAFAPDCVMQCSHTEAAAGNFLFTSKKSWIAASSWREVLFRKEDREEDEAGEDDDFPVFTNSETASVTGWNLLTHQKLPPPLFTEAGLLEEMEKAGLGTVDLRASIIENLFEWDCIQRQGYNLIPSEKGMVIYNFLKDTPVASVKTAAGMEKTLKLIKNGKQSAKTFQDTMQKFIRQVTDETGMIKNHSSA
jgi:DNA topoisomerase-3